MSASPFDIVETTIGGRRVRVFAGFRSTLGRRLDDAAAHGDTEYLVFGDRRISYLEHDRLVGLVAADLRNRFGVGRGDRVAIAAANRVEWILTFWASVRLGAIAVALNAWWSPDELAYAVELTSPKVVVADAARASRLRTAGVAAPIVDVDATAWPGEAPGAPVTRSVEAELTEPTLILYTSGTAGRPKGVVHSHLNVESYLGMVFWDGFRRSSNPVAGPVRQFVTNPLFHVSGLHGATIALLVSGATSVWLEGRFDPVRALATIERERCTGWAFVPTTASRVVRAPEAGGFDLSSVRSIGGGGAPVSPELIEQLESIFANAVANVGVGYGLTESTALVSLIGGEEVRAHPGSVGRPLPLVDVELRDEQGGAGSPLDEGEIVVRGPNVMSGYWGDESATRAAIDDEGWLRTGDLGRLDEHGYLHIVSRRTDLILRGAENVYPAEIERCLESHASVVEVAVVGLEHADLGQEVGAVVVIAGPDAVDVDELATFAAARLAYFKVPARWVLTTEPLERNATGKVVREAARERFAR